MPRYTPETKAAAIADLLGGVQPAIVAERYKIKSGTVRQWKMRYVTQVVTEEKPVTVRVTAPTYRPLVEAQQLSMQDLIEQSLRAKIAATWKIAEYATTPEWLEKQNAADVATLFEVIDRAAVGILDRMAQRRPAAADDADTDA